MNENWRLAAIGAGGTIALYLIVTGMLGLFWSFEPKRFDAGAAASTLAKERDERIVPGYTTGATAIALTSQLLDKPGGFVANDLLPPGVWLDNMSNFERGAVLQLRDFALILRNEWGRPPSQSPEDPDLAEAQEQFQIDTASWAFPSAEGSYRRGAEHLQRYLTRLADDNPQDAHFNPRADQLGEWLGLVQKRLSALTQALSQSVASVPALPATGQTDTALPAPSQAASPALPSPTGWTTRDNIFYEARGQSWALIHLLSAVQVDFAPVLEKRIATVAMNNLVHELEATQDTIWSPVILNGDGFGLVANHSLVMAAYLARANAAITQLRDSLGR